MGEESILPSDNVSKAQLLQHSLREIFSFLPPKIPVEFPKLSPQADNPGLPRDPYVALGRWMQQVDTEAEAAIRASAQRIWRRRHQEGKDALKQKLAGVLSQSPTTHCFQIKCVEVFDDVYVAGSQKHSAYSKNELIDLLEDGDSEVSTGIFLPTTAKEIEKTFYRLYREWQSAIDDANELFAPEATQEAKAFYEQWREEYRMLHDSEEIDE